MIFLQTFFQIILISLLLPLVYAVTSAGKNFNLLKWFALSRNRLLSAVALVLAISYLLAFHAESSAEILSAAGFNSNKPLGIGLFIGGALVAIIRGNKK